MYYNENGAVATTNQIHEAMYGCKTIYIICADHGFQAFIPNQGCMVCNNQWHACLAGEWACPECYATVTPNDEIPDYPGIYECPECGHPI